MGTPSDGGGAATPRDLEVMAIRAEPGGLGRGPSPWRHEARRLCPSLGLNDLEAHLAQLASMRRAEHGLANHWVAWLAGARGLDLHADSRGSRPVVFQIALELGRRQIASVSDTDSTGRAPSNSGTGTLLPREAMPRSRLTAKRYRG